MHIYVEKENTPCIEQRQNNIIEKMQRVDSSPKLCNQ